MNRRSHRRFCNSTNTTGHGTRSRDDLAIVKSAGTRTERFLVRKTEHHGVDTHLTTFNQKSAARGFPTDRFCYSTNTSGHQSVRSESAAQRAERKEQENTGEPHKTRLSLLLRGAPSHAQSQQPRLGVRASTGTGKSLYDTVNNHRGVLDIPFLSLRDCSTCHPLDTTGFYFGHGRQSLSDYLKHFMHILPRRTHSVVS